MCFDERIELMRLCIHSRLMLREFLVKLRVQDLYLEADLYANHMVPDRQGSAAHEIPNHWISPKLYRFIYTIKIVNWSAFLWVFLNRKQVQNRLLVLMVFGHLGPEGSLAEEVDLMIFYIQVLVLIIYLWALTVLYRFIKLWKT